MTRATGWTAGTPGNLQLDAGVLYAGSTALGIAKGGATFTPGNEIRDPEWVGKGHKTAGTRRITYQMPKLTVKLMEWTQDNVDKAVIGSTGVLYDYIIPDAAYIDTMTYVTDKYTITLSNVLPDGNLALAMADKSEGAMEISFMPHYAATDYTFATPPWTVLLNT